LIRGLPLVAAVIVFMPTFSVMKASIPLFTDYTWGAALIAADRAIFGTDPWRLLQPLVGYPFITSALSVAYHLWLLLIYAGSVWFAVYCRDDAVRLRYFASYFTLWTVCGIAMAIGLASVGPCFVSPILGLDAFGEQMDYLNAANQRYPVMVLEVQEILLQWHRSGQHGLGRGITAMPSMHVALATLFWLAIRRGSRLLDLFFGLFLVVIFIGSIHLAYHYAVDGIVGAAIAFGIWRMSGKAVQQAARLSGRTSPRDPSPPLTNSPGLSPIELGGSHPFACKDAVMGRRCAHQRLRAAFADQLVLFSTEPLVCRLAHSFGPAKAQQSHTLPRPPISRHRWRIRSSEPERMMVTSLPPVVASRVARSRWLRPRLVG
jgi:hypothetical protein